MEPLNFSTYRFRCSFLPTLMVNPRSKSELLSETAKAGIREVWIREVFKREKFDTTNKYTEKGILCEPEAMDLVQEVTQDTYFKNKTEFKNDFITGTPDIVAEFNAADDSNSKFVIVKDIKNSWNIWTFAAVDESSALKQYYHQLLGYMWLTGAKKAQLIFTLVNTPDEIMNDELYKLSFKFPEINESDEKADRFKRNYKFDDIPAKLRMKVFNIEYNEFDVELLKQRIIAGREYLNSISL